VKVDINEIDPRLANVEFVCEATSCEKQDLWSKFHFGVRSINGQRCTCGADDFTRYSWESDNMGLQIEVGRFFGHPVVILVWFVKVNGLNVMFWEDTSRVVDHDIIKEWLRDNVAPKWDHGQRLAHTDAINFHHVIHASKEKEKKIHESA